MHITYTNLYLKEDEQSHFNIKQNCLWSMYITRKWLIPRTVCELKYEEYTFLISRYEGKVYRYNNRKYTRSVKDGMITLIQLSTGSEMIVYSHGHFKPSSRMWLMESGQKAGGKGHSCFTINGGQKQIIIRDYQVSAVIKYGKRAFYTLENIILRKKYDVTFKDGNKENISFSNLSISFKSEKIK